MKKLLCFVIALVLLLAGCVKPPSGASEVAASSSDVYSVSSQPTTLTAENFPIIDGSTSTKPLDAAIRATLLGIDLAEATAAVNHTTTFGSFINLLNGDCDMILTVPLSDSQLQKAEKKGVTLARTAIAREAFVFVLNSQNPVTELSQQQLRDIYSGKITNWKDVCGDDAQIIAYQRNEDSGSQTYMVNFMGDTQLMQPVTTFRPETMGALMDAIAVFDNSKYAIGYSVYAYAAEMYGTGTELKFAAVDGIAPDKTTLSDGSYPLLSYNYAVFDSAQPEGSAVRVLCDWLLTDAGQQAVAAGGYIPLSGGGDSGHPNAYTKLGSGGDEKSSSAPTCYYSLILNGYFNPDIGLSGKYSDGLLSLDFIGLTDHAVGKAVNDWLDSAVAQQQAKVEEFYLWLSQTDDGYGANYSHGGYGLNSGPFFYNANCVNGYLSLAVGLACSSGQVQHYSVSTAVFDLYTAKQMSLDELFYDGADIAGELNRQINQSLTLSWEQPATTHDNPSLTNAEAAHFTLDTLYFTLGNHCFTESPAVAISFLTADSVVSKPRDMAGMWSERADIQKLFVTEEGLGDRCRSVKIEAGEYAGSELHLPIIAKSEYVTAETAEKINTEYLKYVRELRSHPPEYYLKLSGRSYEELVDWLIGYDEDYTIPYESVLQEGFCDIDGGYSVIGGKYVTFGPSGPRVYFNEGGPAYVPLPVSLIFDAKTGERYNIDDLFTEGWQTAAKWYDTFSRYVSNEETGETELAARRELDPPKVGELILCDIDIRYSAGGNNTVFLLFLSADGKTLYYAEVGAEYINWE